MGLVYNYADNKGGLRVPLRFKGIIGEIEVREKKKLGEICFIFVSRTRILNINQIFLNHDYITDVITFSNSVKSMVAGDIYVCEDMVRENAIALGIPFESEIQRVMIHGLLHLVGYDDRSLSELKLMRDREDLYLKIIESRRFW